MAFAADGDNGLVLGEIQQLFVAEPSTDDHEAIDLSRHEQANAVRFVTVAAPVAGDDDGGVATAHQFVFHALGCTRGIGVVEILRQHPNGHAHPAAQAFCHQIRLEAQLLDRGLDGIALGRVDLPVQDARHGAGRNTSQASDILQGRTLLRGTSVRQVAVPSIFEASH